MKKLIALLAVIGLSLGCATVLDWGQDACDAVLSGSKAGNLCAELDKLRSDEEAGEASE